MLFDDVHAFDDDAARFREGLLHLALFAGIGFLLGIPIIVAWDRHMKKVNGLRFHIVEIKKACSGM